MDDTDVSGRLMVGTINDDTDRLDAFRWLGRQLFRDFAQKCGTNEM